MTTIRDKFIASIKANQRTFSHNRALTLGASETFACLRKAYFAKHHPELAEGDKNWGILERGNVIENAYAVPRLMDIYGVDNCLYMGKEQETLIIGKSSVTPDGLIINQPRDALADDGLPDIISNCFTCEIKSFDSRMNLREEKMVHHGQTIMQMGHIRRLTTWEPHFAVLLYINSSDFSDIRPFIIPYKEETYQLGVQRSEKVFDCKDVNKLLPEGKFTDQCRYCDFTKSCNAAELRAFPTAAKNYSPEDVNHLGNLANEYDSASQEEKDAKARKEEVSARIKQYMSAINSKGVESESFKLTYSKVKGRESLDSDSLSRYLASHGKSLDDFQKIGDDYTRLTVTIRE